MKALFWNIGGMGKKAKVGQLKDILMTEKVDIVGIQETIKHDFTDYDLNALVPGGDFVWN